MPIWLQNVLSSGVVTAVAIWIIKKYVVGRIKFDFDQKIEQLKPLTAEETLRRENRLNSKRDTFFDAIDAISRYLESTPWSGPDVPADRPVQGQRPSEAEVNACHAKLSIYSDDLTIPDAFILCFEGASPASLGRFIKSLRKDLGYENSSFDPEHYKYHFKRELDHK